MFNKDAIKQWSTWLTTVGTLALGFFLMLPDQALTVWNLLPDELKATMPQATGLQISLALLASSILAKFVKQKPVADFLKAKLGAFVAWVRLMGIAGAVKKQAAAGFMILTMSAGGMNFLIEREGVRLEAYLDVAGIPTICVGHTGPEVKLGMKLTFAQCQVILKADTEKARAALIACVKRPLGRNQSDALISLAFNIGNAGACGSQVVARINADDFIGAAAMFKNWSYATIGGVKKPVLRSRRDLESALFLRPDNDNLPWETTTGRLKALAKAGAQ